MEKKKVLIVIGLVGLAGVGYYLYKKNQTANVGDSAEDSTEESKEVGLEVKVPDTGKIRESVSAMDRLRTKTPTSTGITTKSPTTDSSIQRQRGLSSDNKASITSVFGIKTSTSPCGKKPFDAFGKARWEQCMSNLASSGSSGSRFDGYISHSNFVETDNILNEFDI